MVIPDQCQPVWAEHWKNNQPQWLRKIIISHYGFEDKWQYIWHKQNYIHTCTCTVHCSSILVSLTSEYILFYSQYHLWTEPLKYMYTYIVCTCNISIPPTWTAMILQAIKVTDVHVCTHNVECMCIITVYHKLQSSRMRTHLTHV